MVENLMVSIETGGKQYNVSKNSTIDIEKLQYNEGDEFDFDKILFLYNKDDNSFQFGKPFMSSVKVKAKVISTFRNDKKIIFKKKRRKGYMRFKTHRQYQTKVQIQDIIVN